VEEWLGGADLPVRVGGGAGAGVVAMGIGQRELR
jgi:hypothetical protein